MIVLEEQCFLVTLSFNISTLVKTAFLKKTATTFYYYSGLTAGSITLLNIISSWYIIVRSFFPPYFLRYFTIFGIVRFALACE